MSKFCPKCGHTGIQSRSNVCPKCGERITAKPRGGDLILPKKGVLIPIIVVVALIGAVIYAALTNEQVATEFRQVRQARPNMFFVGVDVSATISTDTIEKLKDAVLDRLEHFIGDPSVSYHVMTFGNPGCSENSFREVTLAQAVPDKLTFSWKVEEKIRAIEIAKVSPRDASPLTTPLYCFLDNILNKYPGGRIIIFSDLMNDDSDCDRQFLFPEESIQRFGENRNGQIIFLYPKPHLTENPELNRRMLAKQQEFIDQMTALSREGKVRTFFYEIPDDPLKTLGFMQAQFKTAIPATMFDVVWERTARVFHTIVSAVRG